MSWFKTRLFDLLPALYRTRDNGDLEAFLKILAPTLDALKEDIDRFPSIIDLMACDEQYLALLARLVGREYDGRMDPPRQRRRVAQSVPYYHRKTTPARIVRDLIELGWRGVLLESFPRTMRLGIHARLNQACLAGRVYNDGTAVIECANLVDLQAVRRVIQFHQPAGTLFFLRGRQAVIEEAAAGLRAWEMQRVRNSGALGVALNHAEAQALRYRCGPFTLGQSRLGRYDRLVFSSLEMTEGEAL